MILYKPTCVCGGHGADSFICSFIPSMCLNHSELSQRVCRLNTVSIKIVREPRARISLSREVAATVDAKCM